MATIQNDPANRGVSWSLVGAGCSGSACGILSNLTLTSVTYTAPQNIPSLPNVTLVAASITDASKTSSSAITITNAPQPISVSVTPPISFTQVNRTTAFAAMVQNDAANRGVTWALSGTGCSGAACGTLSNITPTSVTYSAPANAPNPPSITLTATSIADSSKSSSATIMVTAAPQPISIAVNPSAAAIQVNQNAPFTASVQNDAASRGVTWALSGPGCSGAACGTLSNITPTSVTYAAPANVPSPATVTLAATSASDVTKTSSATITITTAPQPISVAVNPSTAAIQVNQNAPFTASVQNDAASRGVTWALSGPGCAGASCGTLSAATATSVTYYAPGNVPNPASITLTATSISDNTKSSAASITVVAPPVSVSIAPTSATVQLNQAASFTASVLNDGANRGVTWTLSGPGCAGAACGALSNVTTTSVTYTAPASVPNPGTVTLTAISIADTSKSASAAINVADPPPPISVAATPTSASVPLSQSASFTATVQNDSANRGVTWSLTGSGCVGSTCGMLSNITTSSVTYTAPNAVPNPPQVSLVATSVSDSGRSASVGISVFAPGSIRVTLSPKRVALTSSQQQRFTATVTGTSDTRVNWFVDDVPNGNSSVGTIADGLYVPGTNAGRHTVTSRSIIDSSSSASSWVAVTDVAGVFSWRGTEGDTSRQGINPKEYALDSTTLSNATFGKLFSCSIDGYAYAQPLYFANLAIPGRDTHNVIFVATTYASVYAFDADSNANPCVPLWQKSLLGAGEAPFTWNDTFGAPCEDVTPLIGLTATPVIDPVTKTLYAVTKTKDSSRNFFNRLHALDILDGHEKFGGPVLVQASFPGSGPGSSGGIINFNQQTQYEKAGLALANGIVYTSWSSHCDRGAYNGWVIGYEAATLRRRSVFNPTPNGSEGQGSVWMSGAAPAVDSDGSIYVITSNGTFDSNATVPPRAPNNDYADSAIKLNFANGDSPLVDFFTPANQLFISSNDYDFGSTGAVLLPDLPGSPSRLMFGIAKDTNFYLINRDNMGRYQTGPGGTDRVVQKFSVAPPRGVWSTPAYWNNKIYVVPGPYGEILRPMFSYQFDPQSKCFTPCQSPTPVSRTADVFPYPGGVPNLSARGSSDGGILWLVSPDVRNRGKMQLHAFDPSNLANEYYNSLQAGVSTQPYVKFTVPTIVNGKVYVGTQTTLEVFGLLPD